MGNLSNGSTGSVGSTGSTGSTGSSGSTGSAGTNISGSVIFGLSGTYSWVVPYFSTMTVELWGAGGSGGSAYNGNTQSEGGEGGDYKKYTISSGQLTVGSTITLIVGAGGITLRGNGTAGGAGGYTVFGDRIWAQGGDGGAGQFAAATAAASYSPGTAHSFTLVTTESGGTKGFYAVGGSVTNAGGGGGGAINNTSAQRAGGSSTYGGQGGIGGNQSYDPGAGQSPGGGSGGYVWAYGGPLPGGEGRISISWTV